MPASLQSAEIRAQQLLRVGQILPKIEIGSPVRLVGVCQQVARDHRSCFVFVAIILTVPSSYATRFLGKRALGSSNNLSRVRNRPRPAIVRWTHLPPFP